MSQPARPAANSPARPAAAKPGAKPVAKPGARHAAAARPVAAPVTHAAKASERLTYVVAVVLLAAVGYVAWRTQIKGETLAQALPFLADEAAPADTGAEGTESDGTGSGNFRAPTAPKADSSNTVFGRKSAPARPDMGARPGE